MIASDILDAAVAGVMRKPRLMPDGVRRWIPASTPMTEDDEPVSAEFIADLVAKLNSEMVSVPIDLDDDNGNAAHETAHMRALGWAHRGVIFDGQLFLESEVKPHIAAAIDAGTLAYSSIYANYKKAADGSYLPGTAYLYTHALTNTPRNRKISAMQSVLHAHTAHSYTRARLASSEESMKIKKTTTEAETPKVETIQATEPAPAAPAETTAAEGDAPAMTYEQAMEKIAELEAKLAAMEAATEASAIEASAETAEQKRETAAVAAVERAIGEGRITAHARDKWLASARADLATFTATVGKRPAMTRPIVARAESSGGIVNSTVQTYSEDEAHLAAMLRSGGLTEEKIKATIADRRGKVV